MIDPLLLAGVVLLLAGLVFAYFAFQFWRILKAEGL